MRRIAFSDGWRYAHLGKEDWRQVTLPHDAMLSEPRTAESAGGTNTGWFAEADYEYVKEFDAPEDAAYLEFEGVYHRAEVELDDRRMDAHPNGYFGFQVPVSAGHHRLRVIARNAEQPSSRWYSGAGIYRPVSLVCLPEKHILPDSVHIRTLDFEKRLISVSFETSVPGEVIVEACGQKATGEREVRLTLTGAELWSPEHPALHTVSLTFGEDTQQVRFGIRTISLDAKRGFRMNGERVVLLGACIHHDNGILGAAGHPFAERRKVELLKKAGFNAIRSAHNPASKALLEACDELGMLMLDEYVDMWYIHKIKYDYADYVEKNWQRDLAALVKKDRNHPSVVMYSIGNEVSETAQEKGIALTEQMTQYLHQLDDRPVTCGINIFFNYLSSMGFGVYSDKKAEQEAKKAEQAKGKPKKKKAVGSEFINNVAGFFGAGFMKFGATLHGSNVKTRDAYAKLDAAGYNYGAYRYRRDLRNYPERVILGSETFTEDALAFYETAKTHPALIGDFVWTGLDHLGEVGLGAWEYPAYAPRFDKGPGWITSGAGVIDLVGTETGQTAYTQVAFDQSPIRIGVKPVCFAGEKHSSAAWRMTNTMESWSWQGCEGRQAEVEVYTKAAFAELMLNGKSLGKRKTDKKGIARFTVPYENGELTAIARDRAGTELARTSLTSAGEKTVLTMIPERDTVSDGELLYIRLRYTDEDGTVKPGVRGEIQVSVTGGTLLALGNACSYNERGYLTDRTDTYYGEALAIIRPEGDVTLRADSKYGSAACHCFTSSVLEHSPGEKEPAAFSRDEPQKPNRFFLKPRKPE